MSQHGLVNAVFLLRCIKASWAQTQTRLRLWTLCWSQLISALHQAELMLGSVTRGWTGQVCSVWPEKCVWTEACGAGASAQLAPEVSFLLRQSKVDPAEVALPPLRSCEANKQRDDGALDRLCPPTSARPREMELQILIKDKLFSQHLVCPARRKWPACCSRSSTDASQAVSLRAESGCSHRRCSALSSWCRMETV